MNIQLLGTLAGDFVKLALLVHALRIRVPPSSCICLFFLIKLYWISCEEVLQSD